MNEWMYFVNANDVYVIRLLVAMVLGGLVGIERQVRGRPAGLRTNILVCLGSAAVIIAFQKLFFELHLDANSVVRMDPARAAAGVITGIGFLGAGTIIKSKDFVRGLTTAASIWVVAAIGITTGLGEYGVSVVLTGLVLIALYTLHRLPIKSDHYYLLHLIWHGDIDLLDEVIAQLHRQNFRIKGRRISRQPKTGKCEAVLDLRIREKQYENSLFNRLQSDERFDEVSWR